MRSRLLLLLSLLPLCLVLAERRALSAVPKPSNELHEALDRWVTDYRRGSFGEFLQGKNMRRYRPYLTMELVARTDRIGRPTRLLEEVEVLVQLAREGGDYEDGKLLVEALLHEERKAPKKGASPSFWVRQMLHRVIEGRGCPDGIQSAFMDRLQEGLRETGDTYTHRDPEEAQRLLPVLGSFQNPAARPLMERLLGSEQTELAVAAAEALGRLGSGAALPGLAKLLGRLEDGDELTLTARALLQLTQAQTPPPEERDLKYALDVALTQLQERPNWRARMALIPITRAIRGVASVPVLIGLLEDAAKGRDADAFSGTLTSAIQASLQDLTGFYAPAHEPEKWRKFWEEQQDTFQLAPERKQGEAKKGDTVSRGFFGIPVTGSRIVFVLDVSGSMREPASGATVSRGPGGRPSGSFTSKLDKAKQELMRAVEGLTADAEFNVIFFENRVRPWQKRLVSANKRNKARLAKTVEKLRPEGGTALYDGLNEGLKIQTRRSKRSRYPSNVDEVFLLSDGIPSPNLSEIWDTEQILERVTKWNIGARVRIHTVFLRTVVPPGARLAPGAPEMLRKAEEFMKKLAEDNDGRYIAQ
jgi:hypothetical protein